MDPVIMERRNWFDKVGNMAQKLAVPFRTHGA